jgi:acyl-CoA reductase-like NAD-dependent aldehyde dehydrogenase
MANTGLPYMVARWRLSTRQQKCVCIFSRRDEHDVQSAVAAAKNASASWARTPLAKRQAILQRISDLILENIESFIAAEVEDSGKPASWLEGLISPGPRPILHSSLQLHHNWQRRLITCRLKH